MSKLKTTQSVIAEFQANHGQRYGYEFVSYKGSSSKVKVVCKKHGVFEIAPDHHRKGVGCRQCYFDAQKLTKADWVSRSRTNFGERFDYDGFDELPTTNEKVLIRCKVHDQVFFQSPRNHMRGHIGCPKCKSLKLSGDRETRGVLKSEDDLKKQFVLKAVVAHGNAFDYSEFKYVTATTNGKIFCPKHGAFWQTPSNHLRGAGCPKCSRALKRIGSLKEHYGQPDIDCVDTRGYWRALKRRAAGMSKEKIFSAEFVRGLRRGVLVRVGGTLYPNIEEAARICKPTASTATIGRWLAEGVAPEEAFCRVPNPGYANGFVYLLFNIAEEMGYVGQSVRRFGMRNADHLDAAVSDAIYSDKSVQAAFRRYGVEAFVVVIIDHGTSLIDLGEKERKHIREHGTLAPDGFNISPGGTSGGSNPKPRVIDGIYFRSTGLAALYVAATRGISFAAAKKRIQVGRIDVKTPAKAGQSLVKTAAYKAWSRLIHGVVNPRSKNFVLGLAVCDRWRDFQAFLEDVGQPPHKGMAFTRLDKAQGFYPDNCKWLSKSESSQINAAFMKKNGTLVGNPRRIK